MEAESALKSLARQTGYSVLFQSADVAGIKTNAIDGSYTLKDVLPVLFRETGLNGHLTRRGVITILHKPAGGVGKVTTKNGKGLFWDKLAAALASVLVVHPAVSADGTKSPQGGLEEIIVTAQRREENLQAVPIAVTALGADMLESFRVADIQDLSGLAPNLYLLDQGVRSTPVVSIRGIRSGTSDNAVDPKVGLYLDGVYVGRSVGAIFDVAEIERVEVLRGPQGTLFGRNATGGAISMITSSPTGEFGLKQDISFGSNDAFRARTNLNLPALGMLSVKFSYLHDEDSGTSDNLIGGQRIDLRSFDPDFGVLKYDDDLGSKDADAFMVAARLALNDDLTVDYKFDYTDSDTVGNPSQMLGITGGALNGMVQFINSLQPQYGGITNVSIKRLNNVAAATSVEPLEVLGHNLTVNWGISDEVNFKSITAWREMKQKPNIYDLAATGGWKLTSAQLAGLLTGNYGAVFNPANAPGANDSFFDLLTARSTSQRQFSQELQLTVTKEWFDLVGGVFYFTEHSPGLNALGIMKPIDDGVAEPAWFDSIFGTGTNESITDNESVAIYAQGTWHATDKLDLTAGIRRTEDTRETEIVQAVGAAGGGALQPGVYDTDFGKTNYTLIASYTFREDLMAYAKFATGYVAGGVMSSIPYGPEEVESYELGLKSQWLDNRLRVNAATFFMDYTDMQVATFIDGVQNYENAGKAEITGLELEVEAVPVDGLTLSGTLGWTDFEYKEFFVRGVDMSDVIRTTGTPEWNARLSAQYDFEALGFGGVPYVRLDSRWRTESDIVAQPPDPVLADIAVTDEHWIVDARVGIVDIPLSETTMAVSLWAKNLLDEDDIIDFGPEVINQTGQFINERTYGVDFSIAL
ncbi:MAG: TonB-dependent receptor [Gammaproteobacteria bacterium]|nr:TonB-dependent receptor [Gammaproteobacteria bacterium]